MRVIADEIRVSFVIERADIERANIEGAEINKDFGFNSRVFMVTCFCFTKDLFSFFYSHFFLNASFIDQ